MTRLVVAVLAIASILGSTSGCQSGREGTLYVYYDTVLNPVMEAIAAKFEKTSGYNVKLMPDPEDRIFQRMKLSKHADLFLSFTPSYIQRAKSSGLTDSGQTVCFIMPTMITAPLNPLKIHSVHDLEEVDLRIGADLREDSILSTTTRRLVEKNDLDWEGVRQAVFHPAISEGSMVESLQSSEIDVAILWETTARQQTLIYIVPIEPEENVCLPMVAMDLEKSKYPVAAADFVEFMSSPEAQAIWSEYGFKPLAKEIGQGCSVENRFEKDMQPRKARKNTKGK